MGDDFQHIQQLKKRKFLEGYSKLGTVLHAARSARIDRTTHYNWLKDDPDYVTAFEQAQENATEHLERIARKRAEKMSDTLLIFLLKSLRPGIYRDSIKVRGSTDGKTATFTLDLNGERSSE